MKISTALLFLVLAVALGPPAHASLQNRPPGPDFGMETHALDPSVIQHSGIQRPGRCCLSYNTANIQCEIMTDYFPRISGCLLPAVIFKTKKGIGVCAYPRTKTVKHCMEVLDSVKKQGKVLVEEKLQ